MDLNEPFLKGRLKGHGHPLQAFFPGLGILGGLALCFRDGLSLPKWRVESLKIGQPFVNRWSIARELNGRAV
jgi:hypothetical protein